MRSVMTKVIEAIYSDGVLKPVEALELPDDQRVRLTVEPIDGDQNLNREEAKKRLIERLKHSELRLTGPLPTRDELHER